MKAIERVITTVCHAVLWISTSVIFVILCVNTMLRYLSGSSWQWANEVPELLFPWLVMAGVVLAAAHGAHIATTFLVAKLSFKVRRPLATLTWVCVAGLYGTLAGATYRMLDIVHDEKSPILHVPGSITYACVMAGMAMLALLAVFSAWRSWTSVDQRPGNELTIPQAHW